MEQQLIRTEAEWHEWYAARRRHDIDYEGDMPRSFPALVIWTDTEANGYPDVLADSFTADDLRRLVARMEAT